jgi:transposase-like protein
VTDRLPAATEIERFARHAELFGTACVLETAELYLGERELLRLRIELDTIEANRRGRRSGVRVGRRRRVPELERAEQAQQLVAGGLTSSEAAAQLGISARSAERLLRLARGGQGRSSAGASPSPRPRAHETPAKEQRQ